MANVGEPMSKLEIRYRGMPVWLSSVLLFASCAHAETCVTQSQMLSTEKATLSDTAHTLAVKIQGNDQVGVKYATIPEFAKNFSSIASAIASTSPKLAGDLAEVEQIYILDASMNKANADGSLPDADFVCTLNKGSGEADFSIPSLPPGRYAFAIVQFSGPSPLMLSMLMRQDATGAPWKLAGLFPKESTAAGHDGLWYWSHARAMTASKQPWVAYIYYREAQQLLRPASFVSSTHLESLRSEASSAMPSEMGDDISADAPLVVKGTDGKEYRFIALGPDDSLHKDKLDIVAHLVFDPTISDQAIATQRNRDAMKALLTHHPELRLNFHGMWVLAEAPGRPSVAVESAMDDIQ